MTEPELVVRFIERHIDAIAHSARVGYAKRGRGACVIDASELKGGDEFMDQEILPIRYVYGEDLKKLKDPALLISVDRANFPAQAVLCILLKNESTMGTVIDLDDAIRRVGGQAIVAGTIDDIPIEKLQSPQSPLSRDQVENDLKPFLLNKGWNADDVKYAGDAYLLFMENVDLIASVRQNNPDAAALMLLDLNSKQAIEFANEHISDESIRAAREDADGRNAVPCIVGPATPNVIAGLEQSGFLGAVGLPVAINMHDRFGAMPYYGPDVISLMRTTMAVFHDFTESYFSKPPDTSNE